MLNDSAELSLRLGDYNTDFDGRCHTCQTKTVASVKGIVTAQYSQKLVDVVHSYIPSSLQEKSKKFMPKIA